MKTHIFQFQTSQDIEMKLILKTQIEKPNVTHTQKEKKI